MIPSQQKQHKHTVQSKRLKLALQHNTHAHMRVEEQARHSREDYQTWYCLQEARCAPSECLAASTSV